MSRHDYFRTVEDAHSQVLHTLWSLSDPGKGQRWSMQRLACKQELWVFNMQWKICHQEVPEIYRNNHWAYRLLCLCYVRADCLCCHVAQVFSLLHCLSSALEWKNLSYLGIQFKFLAFNINGSAQKLTIKVPKAASLFWLRYISICGRLVG